MNQKCNSTFGMIITAVVTALVVGGIFYYLKNTGETVVTPGDQIEKPSTMQPASDKDISITRVDEKTKKYADSRHNFSIIFPSTYVYDEIREMSGLWQSNSYESAKNATGDQIIVPTVLIKADKLNGQDYEKFIVEDQNTLGSNLAEMSEKGAVPYEIVKLGDNEFIRINRSDLMDQSWYYTNHKDTVIIFETYWYDEENDEYSEIQKIISSLKF